ADEVAGAAEHDRGTDPDEQGETERLLADVLDGLTIVRDDDDLGRALDGGNLCHRVHRAERIVRRVRDHGLRRLYAGRRRQVQAGRRHHATIGATLLPGRRATLLQTEASLEVADVTAAAWSFRFAQSASNSSREIRKPTPRVSRMPVVCWGCEAF